MLLFFSTVFLGVSFHGLFVTRFRTQICVSRSISLAMPRFVHLQRPLKLFATALPLQNNNEAHFSKWDASNTHAAPYSTALANYHTSNHEAQSRLICALCM